MTRQRALITSIIQGSRDHLTAEQIYLAAKAQLPSIAMGTVYRNLQLMESDRQLRRLDFPGMPQRYDKNLAPHDHAVCVRCGRVTDVHLGDLIQPLAQAAGLDVVDYSLELRDLCPNCQAAERERKA